MGLFSDLWQIWVLSTIRLFSKAQRSWWWFSNLNQVFLLFVDVFIWSYIILIYGTSITQRIWKSDAIFRSWSVLPCDDSQFCCKDTLQGNCYSVTNVTSKFTETRLIQTLLSLSRWFVNSFHWSNGCNRGLGTVILGVSVFLPGADCLLNKVLCGSWHLNPSFLPVS